MDLHVTCTLFQGNDLCPQPFDKPSMCQAAKEHRNSLASRTPCLVLEVLEGIGIST